MTDDDIAAWNATVAAGDPAAIAAHQRTVLRQINAQIMSEDPNYRAAGYKPVL